LAFDEKSPLIGIASARRICGAQNMAAKMTASGIFQSGVFATNARHGASSASRHQALAPRQRGGGKNARGGNGMDNRQNQQSRIKTPTPPCSTTFCLGTAAV